MGCTGEMFGCNSEKLGVPDWDAEVQRGSWGAVMEDEMQWVGCWGALEGSCNTMG